MLSSDWFAKVSQFRMIVYLIWNKKLSDSKHVFGLRIDQIKSSLHRKLKFINFGIFFIAVQKGPQTCEYPSFDCGILSATAVCSN